MNFCKRSSLWSQFQMRLFLLIFKHRAGGKMKKGLCTVLWLFFSDLVCLLSHFAYLKIGEDDNEVLFHIQLSTSLLKEARSHF